MTCFTKLCALALCVNLSNTSHATWYQDRDNSMVDANDAVGESMVVVASKNGSSMGVQVYCPNKPGTVLSAAHSVLDSRKKAASQDRPLRYGIKNLWGIAAFPLSHQNYSEISKNTQITSPGIDNDAWEYDRSKDYAFVTPDRPLKPNNAGVKILNASSADLVKASNAGMLKVYLYRPQTAYALKANGQPDFNSNSYRTKEDKAIYTQPQKVQTACQLTRAGSRFITSTDCPQENRVSGSPYVTEVKRQPHIVGVVVSGKSIHSDRFNPSISGSNFLNSDQFCTDYQNVCGVSCTDIHTVFPKLGKE